MKLRDVVGVCLLVGTLANASALADDSIFAISTQPSGALPTVNTSMIAAAAAPVAGLADSPTMQQRPDDVVAAANTKVDRMAADGIISEQEKIQIKGWFKDLPFHRIVDLKISFLSGTPDLVGVCIQGNPSTYLSVDACASALVFLTSISAHVTSRFLRYENITGKVKRDGSISYSGNEFSVGPSIGYRHENAGDIFGGIPNTGDGVDALISAEWVYWVSRYFGLGLTLDAGATFILSQQYGDGLHSVAPNIKLSLGLSF